MQIIMIHSAQLNAFNLHYSMILIEQVVPHPHSHAHTHTHTVNYVSLRNSENSLFCLLNEHLIIYTNHPLHVMGVLRVVTDIIQCLVVSLGKDHT